ncbi:Gfo/Idh/MocA family protein [Paenibacillus allorhizosphaerae]|uniref:4-carboxy-2-hydroxymuconate-6-semialdehyde dehydrogenase n=1 Tax=Paenibacillus allorhizosphaerae TaxID=2849866 RepID=A0ABM8VES8_9BACL|nr:Gfo/Idh/MocA family oxidoreductase [Paenibacillus allorhizosphaerae]CAG7629917.1 4-carboxy-2-hydroxymuconate-6-semialdehyde dehydrogenase [Paenibacillus allorhizosphaerae]
MDEIKVCVIGAGRLSSKRIYPYLGTGGGQLVGVCDKDLSKAETNAVRYGSRPYSKVDEMLEIEKPDAVIVCIGPEQHYEMAIKLMKLGFPVYTEKPSAPDAAMALEMARISQETGVLCTTAFKKRYNVAYNRAKKWLASFDSSKHYAISVDYASAPYSNDSPRSFFLLDFAIHMIDLTPYLFGDISEVFSFSKGPNAYAVSVKFVSGAIGSLSFNCGRTYELPTEEVEITLEGGNFMSIHNSSCWKIAEDGKAVEWREPPTFISSGDSGNETGHLAEIADFLEAVRCKRSTRSNIYESYKSMVFYEAIKRSAENGEVVKVIYEESK